MLETICTSGECRYQVSDSGEITSQDLARRFRYSGRIGKISKQGLPVYSAYFKSWLWAQQAGRCGYCGDDLAPGLCSRIDHVIPRSGGGSNLPPNVTYSCGACHAGKSNRGIADVRHMIRVRRSSCFGIISPKQVLQLEAVGINLNLAAATEFLCEKEGWAHVSIPVEVAR